MSKYTETVLPTQDTEGTILEALALGQPHAFIVATIDGNDLDIRVAVGGGLASAEMLRNLLIKTLMAVPSTPEAKRDLAAELLRSASESEGHTEGMPDATDGGTLLGAPVTRQNNGTIMVENAPAGTCCDAEPGQPHTGVCRADLPPQEGIGAQDSEVMITHHSGHYGVSDGGEKPCHLEVVHDAHPWRQGLINFRCGGMHHKSDSGACPPWCGIGGPKCASERHKSDSGASSE